MTPLCSWRTIALPSSGAQILPRGRARTRHIDTRQHAVRDWIETRQVTIQYCPTDDMLADIATKPLNPITHARLSKLVLGSTAGCSQASPQNQNKSNHVFKSYFTSHMLNAQFSAHC